MRSHFMRRKPQSVWDFMNEVDSLFQNHWESPSLEKPAESQLYGVAADIEEHENAYLFSFDVPGVEKDDIKIHFSEGRLTVSGERKKKSESTSKNGFQRIEKSYGRFERSFQLPTQIEDSKIQAHYENGQLEVIVPKAEVSTPKSIEIESGKGGLFSKLLGGTESKKEH